MKSAVKMQVFAALVLLGAGAFLAGCKAAPELTQDQAKAMIQAKYDHDPGSVFHVVVDDAGMQLGVQAKYWNGVKRYPNGYWGDFKLTPDGAKLVKLASGGDTIQWRPENPGDPSYLIAMVTVAPVKHSARNIGDVQTLTDKRAVRFTEDADLSSLPAILHSIAQGPGNQLSAQRVANFTLVNGAWTLDSIQ
ncbi:MAG: hypothetical protein ACRD3S_19730 [Terracidiphilus sp.]